MALDSTGFASQVVTDMLLTDYKRQNKVLPIVMNSAASQDVESRFAQLGAVNGYAATVNYTLFSQSDNALSPTSTDGYSTITSLPGSTENPDLSSAYGVLTTANLALSLNRFAVGTHYLPDVQKLLHASGGMLRDAKVVADVSTIMNGYEEGLIGLLAAAGTPESVSAGVASRFAFDYSSEANLLADLGQVQAACAAQNIPDDPSRRVMVLPESARGLILRHANIINHMVIDPSGVSLAAGTIDTLMGFRLVFSNSVSSDTFIVFDPEKVYFVMPAGFVVQDLTDKDRIGTFTRLWSLASFGTLGKTVNAADGDGWSTAKEGVFVGAIS